MTNQATTIQRADRDRTELEAFKRDGFAVVPALVPPPLVEFLWSYVHSKFAAMLLAPGDSLVPNTPSAYGDMAFEGLLAHLRPKIEKCCGCRLFPTYSYFRLYKHGDRLPRHRDRRACEISLSLNIGQVPPTPWPLEIEGRSGHFSASLDPGDALLYRGIDYPHWRARYGGERLVQAFLHYVDRDGPHAAQKFDGRKALMHPRVRRDDAGQAAND